MKTLGSGVSSLLAVAGFVACLALPASGFAATLYSQPDHARAAYTAPAAVAGTWFSMANMAFLQTGQPLYWWLYAQLPQQDTVLSFNGLTGPYSCTVHFDQTSAPQWVRAYTRPVCSNGNPIPVYAASSTVQLYWLGSIGAGGVLYGGGTPQTAGLAQGCTNGIDGTDACAVPPALFVTTDPDATPDATVPRPFNDTATHLAADTYYGGYHFTAAASPYVIDGPVYFRSGTVTVDPGVVVKFRTRGSSLTVHGDASFVSLATKDNPAYFTSYQDDAHGGDTNGDGGAVAPAPGDWGYLSVGCGGVSGSNTFDYIRVYYGGALESDGAHPGLVVCYTKYDGRPAQSYVLRTIEAAYNIDGLLLFNNGQTVSVTGSSFHDNTHSGVFIYRFYNVGNDLSGNWWGSPSGPRSLDNPSGTGDAVIADPYEQNPAVPFLAEDPLAVPPAPAACTPGVNMNCNSSVLFLPGIEASRLYDVEGGERKQWEPNLHDDLHSLYLDHQGNSVRDDVYTKVGDVLDETPVGANIYKSFIARMDSLKSAGKIADWEAAPYDWRLALDDILASGTQTGDRISYLTATSTPYIEQELRRLAATSRTGKVTIVAHSNGGLVAKALMQKLGATTTAALVDKIIFVAVPQAGTPAAVGALLHGHDQAIAYGIVVDEADARTFASTSPFAYQLMPSAQYFTQVDDPVILFDASLPEWIARYGSTIHSQAALHTFLADSYGRVDAKTGPISRPIQGNDTLLSGAESLHADLDVWTPPPGVALIQIAGWGIPTTLSGIEYASTSKPVFCSSPCAERGFSVSAKTTIDGDGTVVVPSALWTSTTAGAVDYWVDLRKYNRDHPFLAAFSATRFEHGRILETDAALNFIADKIAGTTKSLVDYGYLSTEAPAFTGTRLRYALRSPLTLNLYDDQGRHTGISTTTGEVEEQIPGTYYEEFGNVKYIFTDADASAHITMQGYAPGTFTFTVDEYQGDTRMASTTFQDIPTTASTTVSLDIQAGITTLSPMRIDENGDGVIDHALVPKQDGVVILDVTPPEISIVFATSTNALAFIATDDSGAATLAATTTYPSAKKKEKEPHGIATTTVTARDESGNTTVLVYTQRLPSPEKRDTITLQSLAYDGATTTIVNTALSYKWRQNKAGAYTIFASRLTTGATTTEFQYRPKKNQTIIMTKPHDLDDDDSDDDVDSRPVRQVLPGMIIPYLKTEEGGMVIGY